jgi:hypothetical protein
MKVIRFEKNGEEWREFRLGKSGGSGLNGLYPSTNPSYEQLKQYCIDNGLEYERQSKATKQVKMVRMTADEILEQMTVEDLARIKASGKKKDKFYKLVAERIARPITPNDYEDRLNGQKFTMIARGHILEEEAIKEFELRNNVKVDTGSVVWVRDNNEDSIVSPDATIGTTRAVEVKAFDTHRIIRAYDENHYPEECHEQVVKYFIVNPDLEVLHFVMYTDVMPALPYIQFDIKREDVMKDVRELEAFEDAILVQAKELSKRLAF